MTCQQCGQNPATVYFRETVNGQTAEIYLCVACAQKRGLSGGFEILQNPLMGLDIGSFWGSLFADPEVLSQKQEALCPDCGTTYSEIAETGKAGCPACYIAFYDRLLPSIQRIHGKTQHVGKVPGTAEITGRPASELDQLKRQLEQAIDNQEYEECARLRDRIKEFEGTS